MPAIRTASFTESVIREMTRVAQQHGAINLAQGFPDFPMPEAMKDAACAAINGDINQYAITWGAPALRIGIAEKYRRWYDMEVDPDRDITVTCGATEAMASVFLALIDPGDEVIVFEPFYENYGPDAILAEATPRSCRSSAPHWTIDPDACGPRSTRRRRRSSSTLRTIPTGRVLTREEIRLIAELCIEHDVWAITDEIYEHIRYAGEHHVLATWPGHARADDHHLRTLEDVQLHGLATGLRDRSRAQTASRSGRCTTSSPSARRRRCRPPAAVGMSFDADYYNHLSLDYRARRDSLLPSARRGGLQVLDARGRVLRARRLLGAERHGRRRVREVDGGGDRRRDGAGLELLLATGRRARELDALRVLQEAGDARRGRRSGWRAHGSV